MRPWGICVCAHTYTHAHTYTRGKHFHIHGSRVILSPRHHKDLTADKQEESLFPQPCSSFSNLPLAHPDTWCVSKFSGRTRPDSQMLCRHISLQVWLVQSLQTWTFCKLLKGRFRRTHNFWPNMSNTKSHINFGYSTKNYKVTGFKNRIFKGLVIHCIPLYITVLLLLSQYIVIFLIRSCKIFTILNI